MIVEHPLWLLLAAPLAASLWLWPTTVLRTMLRAVLYLLVVLVLSGLSVRLPSRSGTVVVVADRSRSMPDGSATAQKDLIDLICGARSGDDRLGVVAFGETAAVEQAPQATAFGGFVHEVGGEASNLADGLETALALAPEGGAARVVIMSDGRWTGRDPTALAARAAARGVALDFRTMRRPRTGDLAITRVDAPTSVGPGEGFLITAWVTSPNARKATFELRRGGKVLSTGERELTAGLNRVTFRDRAVEPGNQAYTLIVEGGDDPVPENNSARVIVGVSGPRPILHVCRAADSGLARLLAAGGLTVTLKKPEACSWSLEDLSKYSAVILENVPADKIGVRGMGTLAAWVRDTGAGLMVTGGKDSYAPGGYYKSPLEPIMPVSMELRQEHRKLALAVVVALDRSGSMAAPAGAGRTKMDLANLGTVAVVDLLSANDELGVIAVDTAPHTIAPLGRVEDKEAVRGKVLRIQSEGGGIYVYEALAAAAKMVATAKSGAKHIILFADAADAEEPGDYETLLEKCEKAGITVSAIGLGTTADKDAGLLQDVARRGKGRVFFTDRPEDLPRLFAQDAFVAARSTFLEEATKVQATPALETLTGRAFDLVRPLGGYNLCYLRPEAQLAAATVDEYHAPVVAAWQAGAGRVLCYTGEADGRYAIEMAKWPDVGAFYTSLARWTAGSATAGGDDLLVTQEVRNGVHRVEVHLDPERSVEPFNTLPTVRTLQAGADGVPNSAETTMRWTGPDTLTLETPLTQQGAALSTVALPGRPPVPLPPVCLLYSPEYRPADAKDDGTLERLAAATGGVERVDPAGVWAELPHKPRLYSVGSWLLLACLPLLLLEVFDRRTGALSALKPRLRPVKAAVAEANSKKVAAKPAATVEPDVLDALRIARNRSRGRTE